MCPPLVPSQGRADDRREIRYLRPPAEDRLGLRRIRDQYRRIARASRRLTPCYRPAGLRFGRGDYFSHRVPSASTEIEHQARISGSEMGEGADMRLGQILDMNIIANRGAVGGRIVGPV